MAKIATERDFERYKRAAMALHLPVFEAWLELEIKDRLGKVIDHRRQRSHSWFRNAYNLLFEQMGGVQLDDTGNFGAGFLSIKDTAGAIQATTSVFGIGVPNQALETAPNGYRAAAGIDTTGIQVGSSNVGFDFNQFGLTTKITTGSGAGQLAYSASDAPVITWTGGTLTFKVDWIRYFNNNSAAGVTVWEVSLVTRGSLSTNATIWAMARDVLGASVTVPVGGQLKVTYSISLVYPA
jgi:hypothetical protein